MLSKQQFLKAVSAEIGVCKHLFTKIPEAQLEYSPGENMRSTSELLRYLSYCAAAPIESLLNDDWARVQAHVESASEAEAREFPDRMDKQLRQVESLVEGVSDEDLVGRQVTLPWGTKMVLGEALINVPLKFLTAYRMQLFLYAKASGDSQLNVYNCWMGQDPPAQE